MKENLTETIAESIDKPSTYFESPMDVVKDQNLKRDTKQKILKSWKEQATLMSVATEEGMGGGEPSRLDEVSAALAVVDSVMHLKKGSAKH